MRGTANGSGVVEPLARLRAVRASQWSEDVIWRMRRGRGVGLSLRRVRTARTEMPAEAGVRWTSRS
jgi:hypothetical protein